MASSSGEDRNWDVSYRADHGSDGSLSAWPRRSGDSSTISQVRGNDPSCSGRKAGRFLRARMRTSWTMSPVSRGLRSARREPSVCPAMQSRKVAGAKALLRLRFARAGPEEEPERRLVVRRQRWRGVESPIASCRGSERRAGPYGLSSVLAYHIADQSNQGAPIRKGPLTQD